MLLCNSYSKFQKLSQIQFKHDIGRNFRKDKLKTLNDLDEVDKLSKMMDRF